MQKNTFHESLQQILRQDSRYPVDAYLFLKESLDFTMKMLDKPLDGMARHVSASELLEGIRAFTLETFGPMSLTVLNTWGLRCTEDIGNLVFNLVRQGILGKTDSDRIEDFQGGYDFHEAFRRPYLPADPERKPSRRAAKPGAPGSAAPRNANGDQT